MPHKGPGIIFWLANINNVTSQPKKTTMFHGYDKPKSTKYTNRTPTIMPSNYVSQNFHIINSPFSLKRWYYYQ